MSSVSKELVSACSSLGYIHLTLYSLISFKKQIWHVLVLPAVL